MRRNLPQIGLERAHIVLPIEEDGQFSVMENVQAHQPYRRLVAIGYRPALRYQDDAYRYRKKKNDKSRYFIGTEF